MSTRNYTLLIAALLLTGGAAADDRATVAPAPNGLSFPADYRDWQVIAVSHRTDNNTLRAILGNPVAVRAARAGETDPWPDGAVLGKLVWKDAAHAAWPTATVPGKFVHAEFMFKDSQAWAQNGGWGYARWTGEALEPYGKDAGFDQECVACHTPVKDNDWVFTHPARLPKLPN